MKSYKFILGVSLVLGIMITLVSSVAIKIISDMLYQSSLDLAVKNTRLSNKFITRSVKDFIRKGSLREGNDNFLDELKDMTKAGEIRFVWSEKLKDEFGTDPSREPVEETDKKGLSGETVEYFDPAVGISHFITPIYMEKECSACHLKSEPSDVMAALSISIPQYDFTVTSEEQKNAVQRTVIISSVILFILLVLVTELFIGIPYADIRYRIRKLAMIFERAVGRNLAQSTAEFSIFSGIRGINDDIRRIGHYLQKTKTTMDYLEAESGFMNELLMTLPGLLDSELLPKLLESLNSLVRYNVCAMASFNKNSIEISLFSHVNPSENEIEKIRNKIFKAMNEIGVDTSNREIKMSITQLKSLPYTDLPKNHEFPSEIIIHFPFVLKGLVGVFAVFSDQADSYSKEDYSLIVNVAIALSAAYTSRLYYQEMKELAIRDPLTGLLNRRRFFEEMDKEVKRSNRYSLPLSLIMLDLDKFKRINDDYGHQAGDFVLQQISKYILRSTRTTDSVGRFGGEEFVILMPMTRLSDAVQYAERLRREMANYEVKYYEERISITASMGVSLARSNDSASNLLKRADIALYKSKALGGNMVSTGESFEG
jgi:diguanylate cyclase (GGDEF)-like protein